MTGNPINRTAITETGVIGKAQVQQLIDACIADEPPGCTTACPLRVDVRALLADATAGRWEQAAATLRRAVPFPGILARVCPQPCRPACARGDAGDPIRIADLERAVTSLAGPAPAPSVLPRRSRRVVVVGAGLTGATAAFDLARRGYPVTLVDAADRPGGSLRSRPAEQLPTAVLDAELAVLAALGVEVVLDRDVDEAALTRLRTGCDALVVATGPDGATFGLPCDDAGRLVVDPVTGATERDGVFGGGGVSRGRAAASPVLSAADGRRAATSVDRYLQGVSLTGARADAGPGTTCLQVRTEDVPTTDAVVPADPVAGYDDTQARAEASRCLQCACRECVRSCAFLEHFGSTPPLYARRVLHNMMMVKGNHTANRLINSCSLCGLCAEVCPTGVDVGAMLKQVRQRMVRQQSMPPSAHDFALRDMAFSNGEAFALARPAPGTDRSRYAFFPGCQLAGSAPDQVEGLYAHLRATLGDVGLILRCCGAPADWAGRTDLLERSWAEFDQQYAALGSPTLILPCTSCQQVFAAQRPQVPVLSLWTVLREHGLPPGTRPAPEGTTLSIHDPCTSRHEPQIQDDVRHLLAELGYQVEELANSRERTECCSYGGLMWLANREVAEKTVQRRIAQSDRDYLTYCVMCRDLFASRGKRSVHLLDLMSGQDVAARAARPGPGYTQRHENRARLRSGLLRTVWGESMQDPQDAGEPVRLRIGTEVRAVLEDRLILDEDLRAVLVHARSSGERFRDPRTGHWLARHRPHAVTYWVEYTEEDDGSYLVHRAYSHRVQVLGGGRHD